MKISKPWKKSLQHSLSKQVCISDYKSHLIPPASNINFLVSANSRKEINENNDTRVDNYKRPAVKPPIIVLKFFYVLIFFGLWQLGNHLSRKTQVLNIQNVNNYSFLLHGVRPSY